MQTKQYFSFKYKVEIAHNVINVYGHKHDHQMACFNFQICISLSRKMETVGRNIHPIYV